MIDALITSFAVVLFGIVTLYKWIVIISALLSWVKPDPYNPIVQMLDRVTTPVYALVRRTIPTIFGGMDFAPMIIIFFLIFMETFLGQMFASILH